VTQLEAREDFLLSPEEIVRLSPVDQERYARLLRTLVGVESYEQFVERLFPREPVPKHGKILSRELQRARVRPIRTMISWPPGHGKTTLATRGIAWWISGFPADTCSFITYSNEKALKHARQVRTWVRKSGVMMDPESQAASDWKTVFGGGLMSGGLRGRLTGERIPGLLVPDDPYRRMEDAYSPVYRSLVSNWIKSVGLTRMEGGSIVGGHTRWHHLDMIGELSGSAHWRVINLPAIAEAGDLLGRAPGEALWPEMYPVKMCARPCGHAGHLEVIREQVGEWTWAALFQGRPVPLSGGMFDPSWWTERYLVPAKAPDIGLRVRAWDLASTGAPGGPATVGVLMRLTPEQEYIVEHVKVLRLSPGARDAQILETARNDGVDVHISLPQDPGQAGNSQKAHFGKLLDGFVFECTPEGSDNVNGGRSKRDRALPFASQVESGNVYLVIADWNSEYVAELGLFPAGSLSDQVDASSRAYHYLNKSYVDIPSGAPIDFPGRHADQTEERY
jgi:predicted phage terminase large subunit-like protein